MSVLQNHDRESHEYDDIINHPHYRSKTRKPMPVEDRAAQFGSFAALTGYEEQADEAQKGFSESMLLGENVAYITAEEFDQEIIGDYDE